MVVRADKQLTSARAAVVVLVETGLGALYSARYGAGTARLALGVLVATAVGAIGARELVRLGNAPFFAERRRYTTAMAFLLGGPLAAIGVARVGDADVASSFWASVLGVGTLLGIVVFATSPRRGNGVLQRMTASRYGSSLCPNCGMATSNRRRTCSWCGQDLA